MEAVEAENKLFEAIAALIEDHDRTEDEVMDLVSGAVRNCE